MWMMSYNDGSEFNMPDSFNGRKLRTLIPMPAIAASSNDTASANPPHLSRFHGTDVLALNHHLANIAEQSKKEFNTQQVVVSSRWNPTPEQLHTLEELYRRGTRTPSADQIQHITAQLRRYGKIEGKNVFYWFQNHKARERQKRRRQGDEQCGDVEIIERRSESGANRTGYDVEPTKNWPPPINCSSTLSQNSTVPIQRASKAAVSECRADGWVQFNAGELQQRRSISERSATWQMMQLSCSPPTHFINSTTITTIPAATTAPAIGRTMEQNPIKAQDLSIFAAHYREDPNRFLSVGGNGSITVDDRDSGESETLQLFPLRSGDGNERVSQTEANISTTAAMNTNYTSNYQFFEFLPLKN